MEKLDYAFIGAGLANLAAANYLQAHSVDRFLVIEKGGLLEDRKCPTRARHQCVDCSTCATTSGIGGANGLHGNKLCYFPASSSLLQYITEVQLSEAQEYLDSLLFPFFASVHSITGSVEKGATRFQKRYYADVLNQSHFRELISRVCGPLMDAHKILLGTGIDEVKYSRGAFHLYANDKPVVSAKNLIVGTGRSLPGGLKKSLDALGVQFVDPRPDVGIRIEAPDNCFTDRYRYQVDPKFKVRIPGVGDARTFCAHNKGMVVPVRWDNVYYADGAFGVGFSDRTNIALMTRTDAPISEVEGRRWCERINQSIGGGRLLLGITQGKSNCSHVDSLRALIPKLPTEQHEQLMDELFAFIFDSEDSILSIPRSGNVSVYAPAIDRYWETPHLEAQFQSDVPGIYFLGDSAGLSRGFVQALTAGASWAAGRFGLGEQNNIKRKTWRTLV